MEKQHLSSSEIRSRFLAFFEKRGHAILPSSSLVPENDPSVLFNTAGMQPLVPYLMGQKHPLGNRLASCQKCVRTGDIEEVGNHKNLTFFEMLGNWSLGDYFKEDAIKWSYEFLTNKNEGLGLDSTRLYITVFEGDENAPRDLEAVEIWKQYIPENRIYFLPAKNNWWSPGENGPCGPDTEMFYDVTTDGLGDMSHDEYVAADDDGRVVEIWNDVFMQYVKKDGVVVGKLDQKNVDTGSGLERVTMLVQGKTNVYETDLFVSIMDEIKKTAGNTYDERSARIIADHIKTAAMMIADGVRPSNKDQGYILRRLIRRATVRAEKMRFFEGKDEANKNNIFIDLLNAVFNIYEDSGYFHAAVEPIREPEADAMIQIELEVGKFRKTLNSGLKEFEKGADPFILATTYGFPIELTEELATEQGIPIDRAKFDREMTEHQEKSRAGAEQKFKGGLGGTSDKIVRSHTAHHLLLAALRQVLGEHVHQRGSNITDERIRIDFAHDAKMTDEQKAEVEKLVNEWIKENKPMQRIEMPRAEAEKIGAEMEFGVKYPDTVSVYFIGDNLDSAISKEFCGGPHIDHTGLIGNFKIQKEEASSAGVRRIKAVIE
jgi:alanyl-tRNA synthetase